MTYPLNTCCVVVQVVPDNYLYARVALIVKDKSQLSEEQLPALAEVLGEETKAQEVRHTAAIAAGCRWLQVATCMASQPCPCCTVAVQTQQQ